MEKMGGESKSVDLDTSHENPAVSLNRPIALISLLITLHHFFIDVSLINHAIRQASVGATQAIEGPQRIIEAVRLWYHETGPLAEEKNETTMLLSTAHSYCIQLVSLNFELSETSISSTGPFPFVDALTNRQWWTETRHSAK
jgi:hypothetical protein